MKILAIDIGTTGLKMGVFDTTSNDVALIKQYEESYNMNSYNDGLFADIEPQKWVQAIQKGCSVLRHDLSDVEVISLSGTTPGLTAMNNAGEALYPAILMLDQRSRKQAQWIIDTIGLDYLFEHTGNMPVAGGCSLASILWLKEHQPDIFYKTFKFGHSNTFVGCWLTGQFAIDPSSASLSALYNTVKNDLTWNESIVKACDLTTDHLPTITHASSSIGRVKGELAATLGFNGQPHVLIGGNDAVLAAYSGGINTAGDIINVNGTCEITLVCLDTCTPSSDYNIRAHVLPNKWLTLHVMNAGGKAYEWFKNLFCSEMSDNFFYNYFLTDALAEWIDKENSIEYVPYLMGSRYSLEPLQAEFKGLTAEVTRAQVAAALVKGLCEYQKKHLQDMSSIVHLNEIIQVTGGAVSDVLTTAKRKWMWDAEYNYVEQSSLKGAALLGLQFVKS